MNRRELLVGAVATPVLALISLEAEAGQALIYTPSGKSSALWILDLRYNRWQTVERDGNVCYVFQNNDGSWAWRALTFDRITHGRTFVCHTAMRIAEIELAKMLADPDYTGERGGYLSSTLDDERDDA